MYVRPDTDSYTSSLYSPDWRLDTFIVSVANLTRRLSLLLPQIKDSLGNDYGRPKDVVGETRQAFTPSADTAFDVCFENQLVGRSTPIPLPPLTL
jgi:hypothetical protein